MTSQRIGVHARVGAPEDLNSLIDGTRRRSEFFTREEQTKGLEAAGLACMLEPRSGWGYSLNQ
jgi:hypothetical protein